MLGVSLIALDAERLADKLRAPEATVSFIGWLDV
jgi:hypothetical protein